ADRVDALYTVWYGTNRKPLSPVGYGGARDSETHFGRCSVFIPASHKIGSMGSPWWERLVRRMDDRVRVLKIADLSPDDHWRDVFDHMRAVTLDERHALVFIHGYNVSFLDAARRAAQIGFDLQIRGAMAFFSWPSRGSVHAYPADEATIEASEGAITD